MLAEVLLVLSGHPSAFFIPSPVASSADSTASTTLAISPSLAEHLHPGEVASLNTLGQLAFRYKHVRSWALDVQSRAREAVLAETSLKSNAKGKGRAEPNAGTAAPGVYLSMLAAGLIGVLKQYELLIVEMEARVLQLDPGLVQDGRSYVPLTAVVTTFDSWQPVLASLSLLIETLSIAHPAGGSWTPGRILHHLSECCHTGNSRLAEIYTTLLTGVRTLFLTHLVAFLLFGLTAAASTPTSPALGLDAGPDPLNPAHRVYKLNEELIPPSIGHRTRESILYVGRVAATLKREGKALPRDLLDGVREEVMRVDSLDEGEELDRAVSRARAEIGEWLWKHVLTESQVTNAIETFGDYFLLRKADFALSLIREFHHLHQTKLLTANPRSSTAVIRESDLNTAMMRASLGTGAEQDQALDNLSWKLENGPLRPIMPSLQARPRAPGADQGNTTRDIFASAVLGAPLDLRIKIGWPLDLFMTPSAVSAYSEMHAYLFALHDAHSNVQDSWKRLSARHRQRENSGRDLTRAIWGTARAMLFFLDQLIAHFMFDIIDVQHRRLIDELQVVSPGEQDRAGGSDSKLARSHSGISRSASVRSMRPKSSLSRMDVPPARSETPDPPGSPTSDGFGSIGTARSKAPPTPGPTSASFLDFLTLRQMHTRHLAFLREGLLLTDRNRAVAVRDVLDTCKRFSGLVERWTSGGQLDPLSAETEAVDAARMGQVKEIGQTFNDQLSDFFRMLLESQNPVQAKDDTSSTGTGGTSFSRTARTIQMSRLLSLQTSFSASARRPADGAGGGRSKAAKERDEKTMEVEAAMSRHVEQLLLRLDFNGVLTAWVTSEEEGMKSRHVLAEGGL